MASYDYDESEITPREKLAASRQKDIAKRNVSAIKNQLNRQISNYNMANEQNKAFRDVQFNQVGRKNETDRFQAQRDLQNAALGLFGSMNQAMNGSTIGNAMKMLENRNDSENTTYWQQLMDNRNTIGNAYQESYNQNQVAKNDAIANAEKAIRDVEDNLAANLANNNPNLYVAPGTGAAKFNATELYDNKKVEPSLAKLSGYIMPANAEQNVRGKRNTLRRNDYYSQLINRFNGR